MKIRSRIVSTMLALLMVLSHVICMPLSAVAADSAGNDGYVALDGIHFNYENTLTDLKDGTYELLIRAKSTFQMEETNVHSEFSEDGFYVALKDGTYLVELWGGDGATMSPDGTLLGKGGSGGKGGYLYATVKLKAGDVLFYSLGGNGQKTNTWGDGGGANGPGGTHGKEGNTTVGGGGGYSAVYLFDGDDFAARYLNGAGELIQTNVDESDRLSKYIMIAGGGGGAGAFSQDKVARPDGGAGGNVLGSGVTLSGSAYDVEGTCFPGSAGMSSGGDPKYAGKGGGIEPGEPQSSAWGRTDTEWPNDWRGTKNAELDGGAGGAGNLRGGGGGAGFCGGSGGIMESSIWPNNVGGGGGGSSFISSQMSFALSDFERSALTNENPSKTGGAVCITYVEEEDINYLENLTLRFTSSRYMTVVSATATTDFVDPITGETTQKTVVGTEGAEEGDLSEFLLAGVRACVGEDVTVRIVFKPLLHFAGGNNVPLFEHGVIYVETPDGNLHGNGTIKPDRACGFVNVPLNFSVHTKNHSTNDPGHSHNVIDLYEDYYAEIRSILASPSAIPPTQYDFIGSIGDCVVTDLAGNVLTGAIAPTETTKYLISMTVTPKPIAQTGVAAVGAPVTERTFVGVTTVSVSGTQISMLNGNWVTYTKSIEYDAENDQYVLSVGFKSDTNRNLERIPQPPQFNFTEGDGSSKPTQVHTAEILYSGYYYIEIWGGAGGNGGESSTLGTDGGKGGAGGYVGGFFYLEKGQQLHVHVGANGADGSAGEGFLAGGKGGKGGEPSSVALLQLDENGNIKYDVNHEPLIDRYIMIAGGGSGGSGGYVRENNAAPGLKPSVTETSIPNSIGDLESVTAAYKGSDGQDGSLWGMSSTAAGKNAYDGTIYNKNDPSGNNDLGSFDDSQIGEDKYKNQGGGAFHLTYVKLDIASEGENAQVLENYETLFALSKYFTLKDYQVIDNKKREEIENTQLVSAEAESSYTLLRIEDINPITSTVESGGVLYSAIDFTVKLYIVPHEAFIGGNDVMLVDVSEATRSGTNMDTGIRLYQTFINADGAEVGSYIDVAEDRATDYVNVPIRWDALDEELITSRNKVHLVDESAPVSLSQLYSVNETLFDELRKEFEERDEWCRDYVTLLETPIIDDGSGVSGQTDSETLLAPDVTTQYRISLGIVPKAPCYYSKVAGEAEPKTVTKTVTIFAAHRVTFDLAEHIHVDAPQIKSDAYDPDYQGTEPVYIAEVGKDFNATFSIETGDFSLPDHITVKLGGAEGSELVHESDYKYDKEFKTLTVFAASITDALHIEAEETDIQYNLHYLVQKVVDGKPSKTEIHEHIVPMWAGDPIQADADYANALVGAGVDTELLGYTFTWDWGDGSTTPLTHMPVEDWWVIGSFTPNTYTLRIRYVDGAGNPVEEECVADYSFGDSVRVTSPTVSGYVTDTTVVELAVDAAFVASAVDGTVTVDVVYESIQDEVVINLIREDGTVADTCTVTFDFGGVGQYSYTSANSFTYGISASFSGETVSYTVMLPSVVGHHLEEEILSGTLTAGNGDAREVVYLANRYVLRFDPNGGECSETTRTVIYGKSYNYDGETYRAFPEPLSVGSRFLGWTDANGNSVPETSTVILDGQNGDEIVLLASWEVASFTVTVQFVYEDGSAISQAGFETQTHKVAYGATYAYDAPALDGFTATPAQYTGVMPAQNLVLLFTYYEDAALMEMNVTVTWGNLSFTAAYGKWDPEQLGYEPDSFTPNAIGQNIVTVANDSETVNVNAVLAYGATDGFESIDGYFTSEEDAKARKNNTMAVAVKESGSLYVWIDGELPDSLPANQSTVCGTVTVTITPQP